MDPLQQQPVFTEAQAASIAREHFGVAGRALPLPSERDQNFKIQAEDQSFVLKVANPETPSAVLDLEIAAMQIAVGIPTLECPRPIRTRANSPTVLVRDPAGNDCHVRMVTFLQGKMMATIATLPPKTCFQLGVALADLDRGLQHLAHHPAARRQLKWDLNHSAEIVRTGLQDPNFLGEVPGRQADARASVDGFTSPAATGPDVVPGVAQLSQRRALLSHYLAMYEVVEPRVAELPVSVIHNDANDYNILVQANPDAEQGVSIGLIDFGDMLMSTQVNEVAIAGAYLLLRPDWEACVCELVAGYHQQRSLSGNELSVLFPLMTMRLCQSVTIAAMQKQQRPDNEYLSVTESPAWAALERLQECSAQAMHLRFTDACAPRLPRNKQAPAPGLTPLQRQRAHSIAPSLSLAYQTPLHIVRGKGQYLFDAADVTYLDCVNNVCHVGHCHPAVVRAATEQMSQLNTNTRYLHQNLVKYAQRLTQTLPDPLEVCFFVNSGSEANDLALRLARTYSQGTETLVLDHAYHGHTSALIDISPYKFNSPGGLGKAPHVHVLPIPDPYRGRYRRLGSASPAAADANRSDLPAGEVSGRQGDVRPDWLEQYISDAVTQVNAIERNGKQVNVFFAESLLGCGGQVPLPEGYLAPVYEAVRRQGGLCVADEVQVGFGRVGTHFWGFEIQNVVPDIVTMGKPIGNGHPLAAVVTTREIADAFHNGMEYFNTFGGNPVSCAVGLAVLNVIEQEGLQPHALEVGTQLTHALRRLQERFPCLGDVRGSGLFLGIEIVADPDSRMPDAALASTLVEQLKARRILLSVDGPDHNVIKFKPPMVFTAGDADRLVMTLEDRLARL